MKDFNWVRARDDCSASAAFEVLCRNIESDCKIRNILSENSAYVYRRVGNTGPAPRGFSARMARS